MMEDVLAYFCQTHARMTSIAMSLYQERCKIADFFPGKNECEFDLAELYLEQLFAVDALVNYYITPEFLLFGIVHQMSSSYSLVIGPCRLGDISDRFARRIISTSRGSLSMLELPEMMKFLGSLPDKKLEPFLLYLSMVNTSINHIIINPAQILRRESECDISYDISKHMITKDEDNKDHGLKRRNPYQIEAEITYCIKHGLTARLREYNELIDVTDIGTLGTNYLRHYKNALIILNALSIRAAIAGGVNPETCYQLGEIYIRKIEDCNNMKEMTSLSYTLQMDYCGRVNEEHSPVCSDLNINRAKHYINENIHNRLAVNDIAHDLAISPAYLSTRFKSVTGLSLTAYINRQKIKEAKHLLLLTDKPILEISEYLAFSTQSYFQTIFKKVEGITPLNYRNTKQYEIA